MGEGVGTQESNSQLGTLDIRYEWALFYTRCWRPWQMLQQDTARYYTVLH